MLSESTFSCIVRRDLKLHPYVICKSVILSERAKRLRLTLCNHLVQQSPLYFKRLIISNEATFNLHGHVFNKKLTFVTQLIFKAKPKHSYSESVQCPKLWFFFWLWMMATALCHISTHKIRPSIHNHIKKCCSSRYFLTFAIFTGYRL